MNSKLSQALPDVGVYTLASDFRLQCESIAQPLDSLAPSVNARIQACWAAACAENPALFNGDLFAVNGIGWQVQGTVQNISGCYVGYREYVAQLRDPGVQEVLQIHPVGVSGCIWLGDQVLIARRKMHLTHYPGAYELPPAGGVDASVLLPSGEVDVMNLLQIELAEETGITHAMMNPGTGEPWVQQIQPVALVVSEVDPTQSGSTRIYDICYDVFLDPTLDPEYVLTVVSEASAHPMHGEYQEPKWLYKKDISVFLAQNVGDMVPTSRMLLQTKMA